MPKKQQHRPLSLEHLEDRELMTTVPAVKIAEDFSRALADTPFAVQQTIRSNIRPEIVDAVLQMNEDEVIISKNPYVPSANENLTVELDVSIAPDQPNGVVVATRSDGVLTGTDKDTFQNALTFTLEPGGFGIYNYSESGGERLGGRFQTISPELKRNYPYRMVIEDNGTAVRGAIYDGETLIIEISGETAAAVSGGYILFRPQGTLNRLTGTVDNVKVTHGTKEVCVPADPEARITEINEEVTANEAVVVTKQQQQATLEEQLSAQVQAKKDAEGAIETVIPSFSLSKPQNATSASLSFNDVEVNSEVYVQRAYGDSAIVLRRTFTGSAGSMSLPTPPNTDRAGYYVMVVSPKGTTAYLGPWDTIYGRNYGNLTNSSMSDTNRLLLKYDKPADIDIDAIDAEIARLQGLITTLKTEIADLQITIATLEVEKATLHVALEPESHDAKIEEAQRKIALTDLRITKWGRAHKEGDNPTLGEQKDVQMDGFTVLQNSEDAIAELASSIEDMNEELARLQAGADDARIAELESAIAAATLLMQQKHREQIPETRMHISLYENPTDPRQKGMYIMKYKSNLPQIYYEVTLQGEPGSIIRGTQLHPEGIANGRIDVDIRRHEGGNGNGTVTINLYADDSKQKLLDSFSGSYRRDQATVYGESPGEWDGMSTQERIALYEQAIAGLDAAILEHGSAYKEGDGPTLGEQKATFELALERALDAKEYARYEEHGLGRLLRVSQMLSTESLERGEHVTPETLTDAAFYLAGMGEDLNDMAFRLDQLDNETKALFTPVLEQATSSFLVMADAVTEEISDLLPDIQDATALLSSSAEVTTGTYSRHIDVALTTLQGLLRITSWKTQEFNGVLTPADGSTSLQGLSSLDFAQVEGLVQATSFSYTIPDGVTVTARIYHGGQQIGTQSLTGSGSFTYEDETGITAVILTPSTDDASYSISDVALTADANDIFDADVLSSAENGYLSREIAPDYSKPEYILRYPMWENILEDNGILWPRAGYDGASQGMKYFLPYDVGETYSSYALFRPDSGNGSASLGVPVYVNDQEPYVHQYKTEDYTLVDGGIILHPGASRFTAITIASGSNVHVALQQTADDIDGLITQLNTFDPYIELQTIRADYNDVQGFVEGSFGVLEGETPVLAYNQPFHVYADLVNRTGVGGTVTVDVYAGSQAIPQKTLLSSWETSLGAYERKGFRANAIAQGELGTEGLPSVTLVVTLPDGSILVEGGKGRDYGRVNLGGVKRRHNNPPEPTIGASEFTQLPADVQSRLYLNSYNTAQRASLMSTLSDAQRRTVLDAVNAEILGTSSSPVVREIQRSRASGGTVADIRAEHFPQLTFEQAADVVMAAEGETLNEEGLKIINQYTIAMADGLEGLMNDMNYIQGFLLANGPVQTVPITESGTMRLYFDVHEREMVNFHLNGSLERNVDMFLSGGSLLRVGGLSHYAEIEQNSEKAIGSAESVSQILEPGRYWVNITDATNYREGESFAQGPFNVDLHIERTPLNTANIEGMISIDGRNRTQPVRLRVAEFTTDQSGNTQRKTDYNTTEEGKKINKLDPTKHVWIVVHGKDSADDADVMNQLTNSLFKNRELHNFQVVTIDWREAAQDGIFIQDAPWAVGVGQWAARQLLNLGFQPSQINVVGWSHGSYVAYEMGREIQRVSAGQINALVALDAAQNISLLSGYDSSEVNFAHVSQNSLAIDSSVVAGSDTLASTADVAFATRIPSNINLNTLQKHKLAVTAFAHILDKEREAYGPFSSHFSLSSLMQHSSNIDYVFNQYGDFEGIIDIAVDGTQALPQQLIYVNSGTNEEEAVSFHSVNS